MPPNGIQENKGIEPNFSSKPYPGKRKEKKKISGKKGGERQTEKMGGVRPKASNK